MNSGYCQWFPDYVKVIELDNPQPNVEDDAEDTVIVNTNDNDGNMANEATDCEKLGDESKSYLLCMKV